VEVSWVELNSKMMDPVMAQRNVHEQQMVSCTTAGVCTREVRRIYTYSGFTCRVYLFFQVVLSRELQTSLMGGGRGMGHGAGEGSSSDDIDNLTVDLVPYMNTSTFIVSPPSSLHFCTSPPAFQDTSVYILSALFHRQLLNDCNTHTE